LIEPPVGYLILAYGYKMSYHGLKVTFYDTFINERSQINKVTNK